MSDNKTVKFSELTNFSPKQKLATEIADTHKFTLYGGAMGGGKSYWLRWYAIRWLIRMYQIHNLQGVVGAIFCEDYPSLKDRQITKLEMEIPPWLGTLKEDKVFQLCVRLDPAFGGGVLALRNLDDPSKYKSSEFGLIGIDELTKNPYGTFKDLRNRMRWKGLPETKFIAGTNPGEIGHQWVKNYFIDKHYPPEEKEGLKFAYVAAKATDNPFISKDYLDTLESMEERERRAYLDGSWDIFEGQFFSSFDSTVHVVPTVAREDIPATWSRFRSIDTSGRNGITSCHWWALDNDGNPWAIREYYATGKDSDQHAKEIWNLSHYHNAQGQLVPEDYKWTVMDSAAWAKMGMSETTAEVYLRKWEELDLDQGITTAQDSLVPAHKERVMGWDVVNQYLRINTDVDGRRWAKLKLMDCCKNLIRTLPLATVDKNNNQDVDSDGEDHALDETRYFLVTLRGQKSTKGETSTEKKLREMKEKNEENMQNRMYQYFKS